MTKTEDRFTLIATACDDPRFREGVLAAYRELGLDHLVTAMVEDMDWLDQFSPDWPPSINRTSTLPSVRYAPDGTVLDLARPLVDRNGTSWFWGGYSVTGHPLVALHPEANEYWLIAEIWEKHGPFRQAKPAELGGVVPRFVVQHTTPGHWQIAEVGRAGKSYDGVDYTSFETAKAERDRLDAMPRERVAA